MNLNILGPMIDKKSKKLIFMDFLENKTYELSFNKDQNSINLVEVSEELNNSCFKDIQQQQEANISELPLDEINRIFETEQTLTEQNNKNIFGRKSL